jgi:prevent-host-death family protein
MVLVSIIREKECAMTSVTAKQLKDHPTDVLGRVQYGNERVAVTRYGKEVAVVVPIEDARLLERIEDLIDAEDVLKAIEEAEREGTISLDELREKLSRRR